MDAAELVKRCVARDHVAWTEFVKRYETTVIRSVRFKLNKLGVKICADEFRDIVQEVFLAIWESNRLSGLRDITCLKNWLVMLALNKTSNYCRRNIYRDTENILFFDPEDSFETGASTLAAFNRFDTSRALESGEMRAVVESEMKKLSYRYQLALKLNIYDGRKQKDVAAIMNIPMSTVATILRRAKRQLREGIKNILKEK